MHANLKAPASHNRGLVIVNSLPTGHEDAFPATRQMTPDSPANYWALFLAPHRPALHLRVGRCRLVARDRDAKEGDRAVAGREGETEDFLRRGRDGRIGVLVVLHVSRVEVGVVDFRGDQGVAGIT
jgi:hypothetical protein